MVEVGGMTEWLVYACLAASGVSAVLSFVRLLRGPSLPDRVVSLDLVSYQAIALMLVYAILEDQPAFLDVALVLALVAFLGTVAFARYIEYYTVADVEDAKDPS